MNDLIALEMAEMQAEIAWLRARIAYLLAEREKIITNEWQSGFEDFTHLYEGEEKKKPTHKIVPIEFDGC